MLKLFRNRLFVAVLAGHFGVDTLNSLGPVLLAVLAAPLALSNAQIGLALTLYTFISSLSQPPFGWFADRVRTRPAVYGGLGAAWMVLCFILVALSQTWVLLLPFFLLAALGSGLFHPIGTASAAAAHPERAGTATSIFFFSGQLGLAIGPILGGVLFGAVGSMGVLPLVFAALGGAVLMLTAPAAIPPVRSVARPARVITKTAGAAIIAFVMLVALRSSIQATYSAFLPKLFADRGWSPEAYGVLTGSFMFAAAVGNIISGMLADRFGMRAATFWPLLLGVPAGLLCLWAPTPAAAFAASAFTGLLVGGQHSVLVVHAQRLIPARQGFASGLILGFTFTAGGIGTLLSGVAADVWGLYFVMQAVTLLGLPVALLALTLPGREQGEAALASLGVEPHAS